MGCNIEDAAVNYLAALLGSSTVLQEFWLQLNNIGQQGASQLAGAMIINKSLLTMSLLGCSFITSTGATNLVNGLHHNISLRQLQLPEAFKSDCQKLSGYELVQDRVEWYPDVSQQSTVEIVGKTVDCDSLGMSSVNKNEHVVTMVGSFLPQHLL